MSSGIASHASIIPLLGTIGAWVGAVATVVLAVAAWQARTVWRQQILLQRGQALAEDLVVHGRIALRCLELMYYPYQRGQESLRMQAYPGESDDDFRIRAHDGWREQTYIDHVTSIDAFRAASFRASVTLEPRFKELASQLLDGIEDIRQATREMESFRRDCRERPDSTLLDQQRQERKDRYRNIEIRMWSGSPPKILEWTATMSELEERCSTFIKGLGFSPAKQLKTATKE
ncbi:MULTISPECIES: hypothetical protein [unclassified Pseudoxanthomonas]|uniref:hypothetical protein n=1 Tax=unclassified Pseudoxanthomonas TaxID=2645906 RepID=UPI0016127FD5|nr:MULTISPECIES: hypothetical protein [unclassified Pseudoxanthomonas]MBB3275951.1 hypothetical protein [Pseudoxanthomonas sp. OG2]MBV7472968.1 hypothetical protein [Pseudoxanthomonas sp. PXM05]